MAQPLRIDELNETLRASGRIESSHAMQLRRLIYANGTVNQEAARLLLGLDRACSKKDPGFAKLYVEALTDYFVWQTEPKGYVSYDGARLLIDNIGADGHISSSCPDCGEPIEIDVVDRRPEPAEDVFHVVVPARSWWDDIVFT